MGQSSGSVAGAGEPRSQPSPQEALRELRVRASLKDVSALSEEARKQAREKAVALYGEPDPAFQHLGSEQLYDLVRDEQWRTYGLDRRFDLFEVAAPSRLGQAERARLDALVREEDREKILSAARAVALLVEAYELEPLPGDKVALRARAFRDAYGLCKGESFGDQPTAGFCSAVLVRPRVVATAGHCVRSGLESIRFVFGYRMEDGANPPLVLDAAHVFEAEALIGDWVEDPRTGADWALVRLKREVRLPGVAPIPLRAGAPLAEGTPLYVLGHPCGLPCKFAGGAVVRESTKSAYFKANLDTYGGNSGSPVLNAAHELEGILARGQRDFVDVEEKDERGAVHWCQRSLIYPSLDAGALDAVGEDVTRVSELARFLAEEDERAGRRPE